MYLSMYLSFCPVLLKFPPPAMFDQGLSYTLWSRGGLVVSALDFRSGGRCFEPGLCYRVVSLDKKLHSTLSLFIQVYKWVPAIIMLEGNPAMD